MANQTIIPTFTVAAVLIACVAADKTCTGEATINIKSTYTWVPANETAAAAFPSSAHFSPAVCYVSKKAMTFVSGATATPGLKLIAETGQTSTLEEELKNSDDVSMVKTLDGTTPGTGTGDYSTELKVSDANAYVTCVSMIAPSPDWIVGLPSVSMCDKETGKWLTSVEALLVPYDAGTDSGATYTAANAATSPQGAVARATEGVIANYGFIRATSGSSSDATSSGTPSPSPTSTESNTCFPGAATVELVDGSVTPMAELAVGDVVKVGMEKYSKVFMFTHRLAHTSNTFVTLETASGASLALTKSHYIYADGSLVAASAVKVGSTVTLGNGEVDTVVSVGTKIDRGLYNPQTVDGNIVVNGVLSSTYTTSVDPTLAHALLAPFRAIFGAFGAHTAALEAGSHSFAELVRSGQPVEL